MASSRTRENLLNALTIGVVLLTIGLVAFRLMPGNPQKAPATAEGETGVSVPSFADIVKSGWRIGPENARLTIVEFGDFECPACVGFHATVDSMLRRHPRDVALIWRHFPLPYHRLAYPLARASECAGAQGQFKAFYDTAFVLQKELGLITVADVGARAGVPDTKAFAACLGDTARVPAIERDVALAKSLAVPGTPGVLINGKLYMKGASFGVRDLETMLLSQQ